MEQVEVGGTLLPAWLAVADEDERSELATLGVGVGGDTLKIPAEEATRAAMASMFLRRVFYIEREISAHSAAQAREQNALANRYAMITLQLRKRHAAFSAALKDIAATFPYAGKAKSRKVGWGVIGTQKKPDVVEITDEAALIEWAKEHAPASLSFTLSLTYTEARAHLGPEMLSRGDLDIGRGKVRALITTPELPPVVGAVLVIGNTDPYFTVEGLREVTE